jgi:hypothetical protein
LQRAALQPSREIISSNITAHVNACGFQNRRAFRRAAGEGHIRGALGEDNVDFLLWAEQFAAQLDPLSAVPLNPDQQRDRPHSGEQVLKDLLIRFLGCDGQPSWKLTPGASVGDVNSEELEPED